ncbi:hypothetical protein D9758_004277 [Tetrapyrgos nigripes]|uniref:EF-hand domain-containing protein n=1 Tax=Tetrapyrgos nigripes TaxID=182062 RepID=A0A8H5GUD9_9AGAR|nr:hypothetical protein D9758_004277 [Tetrapyrgos nigripes]
MTSSTNTFYCDCCGHPIPVSSPRVHCLSPACHDNYDLCAICALGERFIQNDGTHHPSHPTQIYKISGSIDNDRFRSPRRMGLGLHTDGASDTSVTSTATITYFDRAVGSPTSKSPGRTRSSGLTHHHRRSSGCNSVDSIGSIGSTGSFGSMGSIGSASSFGSMGTYSPATSNSTPSSTPEFKQDYTFGRRLSQLDAPLAAAFNSQYDSDGYAHLHLHDEILQNETQKGWTGWTWPSLFMPDMTPSLTFRQLLDAVFSSLDRQGTGYLTPEAYSRFLDDLGYDVENNVWKSYLRPIQGFVKEDVADQALRAIFDLFSIEYTLAARTLYDSDVAEIRAKSQSHKPRTHSLHLTTPDKLATPTGDPDVDASEPDITALSNQLQALLGSGRGTAFVTATQAGQGFAKKASETHTPTQSRSQSTSTTRQTRSRLSRIKSSSSSSILNPSPRHTRKLTTMPLLTREGFASLTCLNVLCDPDAERRCTRFHQVLGPLPREAFPAYPDLKSLKRVQDVFDHAERMRRISGHGTGTGTGRFVEYANSQMKERMQMHLGVELESSTFGQCHGRGWDVMGDDYNDGVTTLYTTCR